jgi:hypothetical protein
VLSAPRGRLERGRRSRCSEFAPEDDPGRSDLVVQGRLLDTSGIELARSERLTVPRAATFTVISGEADLTGTARKDFY